MSDTYNARIIISVNIDICKTYLYEHLQSLSRQILKIDEVTIGTSLSAEISPIIESIISLNPRKFALMKSLTEDLGGTEALITTTLQGHG